MTVAYVRWRDAVHSMSECEFSQMGELAELHEIGFLVRETEESVTLTLERQESVESARLWLTIPRVNIIEVRKWELSELTKKRRRKS